MVRLLIEDQSCLVYYNPDNIVSVRIEKNLLTINTIYNTSVYSIPKEITEGQATDFVFEISRERNK